MLHYLLLSYLGGLIFFAIIVLAFMISNLGSGKHDRF